METLGAAGMGLDADATWRQETNQLLFKVAYHVGAISGRASIRGQPIPVEGGSK